jgi:hypothetical protein
LHRESDFDEIEAWLGDGQVRKYCCFSYSFHVGKNDSWVLPVALIEGISLRCHACEVIAKFRKIGMLRNLSLLINPFWSI